jgi:hypothetical protein
VQNNVDTKILYLIKTEFEINMLKWDGSNIRNLDGRVAIVTGSNSGTAPDVISRDYFGSAGLIEMRGDPVKIRSNTLFHDADIAVELWEVSENLTGLKFSFKYCDRGYK